MNWLFPGFLAGAALIALPVILHFLRRRQNVIVRFPSLRFLGETAMRDTRRQQLRRWLTLLLRCAAIALIAGAFARPFWQNATASHRRLMVVAMDNSMSMQAAGRWEKLQKWALQQLDELGPGDQAGLLTMNPAPAWLVPLTDDLERVRSTLQNARPGFEKTRYAPALKMAGETLAAKPGAERTLVWMADEQRVGWTGVDFGQTLPPGVKIRLADVQPEPAEQAGITSLEWSLDQPGITAHVRLFTPSSSQRRITVSAGDRILVAQSVKLQAGDNKIFLPFAPVAKADGYRVAMDPDELPADDFAWIASKPAATGIYLDAISGPDFLAHALLSTQKLGSGGMEPAALPPRNWPADGVVILRGDSAFQAPESAQLDGFFDAGGALWIFVDGSDAQVAWLKKHGITVQPRPAAEEAWNLRDWDPEHPMLSAFTGQSLLPLLNVEFHQGFNLGGDELVPIANWPDGKPALVEWSDSGHRLLLAGFTLDRAATDWAVQPSFVPAVHQAVRWLGAFNDKRTDWRVGDLIPLPAAQGVWRGLDGPATQVQKTVSDSVRPTAPGLYEFVSGATRQVLAVNVPADESDLAPWGEPKKFALLESRNSPEKTEKLAAVPLLSSEVAENQQRLWWWLLAGSSVVILAELALANRTTT